MYVRLCTYVTDNPLTRTGGPGAGEARCASRFVLQDVSEKNRDGKRTARERLAEERAKQKTAEKRRRVLIVGGAVVCVLALAAVGGVLAANAGKDKTDTAGPVTAPSGANGDDSLAVPVGKESAKSTLTVWEDFRCPACKSFEDAYRSTIHELTDAGQLKVEYHLATLIDGNMGGSGSLRAANAAACSQDAGKFTAYHDVLFENQPPRRTTRTRRTANSSSWLARSTGWTPPPSRSASTTARTTAGSPSPTRPSRAAVSAAPRRCC